MEACGTAHYWGRVLTEINLYQQCMIECGQKLKRWHADDEIVRKLDEASGIGVLTE